MLGRMRRLAAESNKLHRVPVLRKLNEPARGPGSSSLRSGRRCGGGSPMIYRWRAPSPTPMAGGCGAKCSRSSSAKWISTAASVYLTPELARLLAAQVARVEALGRQLEPTRIFPYLLPHFRARPHAGRGHGARWWASSAPSFGRPGRERARTPDVP